MKPTIIAIIIGGAFVVGAFILSRGGEVPAESVPVNNVTVEDGKQIVSISTAFFGIPGQGFVGESDVRPRQ